MTTQYVPNGVQASPAQIEMVLDAITMWRESDATLWFEMDEEDSTILLFVKEDGATSFARFGVDGKLVGDWVW